MTYVWQAFILILGFVFLVKGADLFVDGSSSVAKIFKIPSVIIGLTIVSIGTSLPEAAVSVTAALKAFTNPEACYLSISNVIGSNIFNSLVVIGASALICPFVVDRMIMKRDFPICTGITILLAFMLRDNTLSRVESIILLILFVSYLVLLVMSAIKNRQNEEENVKTLPVWKSVLFIILGGAGIIAGGQFTVNSSTFFANELRMGETLIGLNVVAIGTSLPELVTSIVAAKKGESEIALGNVVGSNIFNILFILGLSGAIHPLNCEPAALIDTIILISVCALIGLVCLTGKKINRIEGAACIVIYIIYLAYTILRAYSMLPF